MGQPSNVTKKPKARDQTMEDRVVALFKHTTGVHPYRVAKPLLPKLSETRRHIPPSHAPTTSEDFDLYAFEQDYTCDRDDILNHKRFCAAELKAFEAKVLTTRGHEREEEKVHWTDDQLSTFPQHPLDPASFLSTFSTLFLSRQNLRHMTPTHTWSNLIHLDLSENTLEQIPPQAISSQLAVCDFSENAIVELDRHWCPPSNHLLFLNLAMNHVSEVKSWLRHCSSLRGLDLSVNALCSLEEVGQALEKLGQLEYIHMVGNPCMLKPDVSRAHVLAHTALSLTELDQLPVSLDERKVAKDLLQKHMTHARADPLTTLCLQLSVHIVQRTYPS